MWFLKKSISSQSNPDSGLKQTHIDDKVETGHEILVDQPTGLYLVKEDLARGRDRKTTQSITLSKPNAPVLLLGAHDLRAGTGFLYLIR